MQLLNPTFLTEISPLTVIQIGHCKEAQAATEQDLLFSSRATPSGLVATSKSQFSPLQNEGNGHKYFCCCCFLFFFIEVQLIQNVVLISAAQQSDSDIDTQREIQIYTHTHILFYILSHYGLSKILNIVPCYTLGPCQFPAIHQDLVVYPFCI